MGGNDFNSNTLLEQKIPILQTAKVLETADTTKSNRIIVELIGKDTKNKSNPIQCIPLLPRYFNILPEKGDLVFIFQKDYIKSAPGTDSNTIRYWIGPLINQNKDLNGDEFNNAKSVLPDGYTILDADNSGEGSYGNPEKGDVILQGKNNTDIIQKNREVWIRAGKFELKESEDGKTTQASFNDVDPGYIQLKYGKDLIKQETEDYVETIYITQKPDFTFRVSVNTYDVENEILDGNLPPEYYKGDNILKTEIFITLYRYKDNKLIEVYPPTSGGNNEYIGSDSRQQALNFVKSWVDQRKGDKWLIKSPASDLIKIYKGSNNVAIASMPPKPQEKRLQRNVLTKGVDEKNSVINVVANKINLLSHNGEHSFDLTNPEKLITDEEQSVINKTAHPLVYGDTLVEFLELVKKYVSLHVHPYNGLPPDPSKTTTDVLNFNLNKILNKNINSN
jgi:hypothetical protein